MGERGIVKNYKVMLDGRNMEPGEIVESILKNRGIKNINHFLNPQKSDLLPLNYLVDIEGAGKIVEGGLKDKKNFLVHFDVDTDGVSAGVIMTRYLKKYTDKVQCTINRKKAHGLLEQDMERFVETDILIVVDSLDKNEKAYEEIAGRGVKIIVLDHHAIDPMIPYDQYITLVSSQKNYPNPALSGAGVVWKFCKYLDEYFMEDYADEFLDLAACGIVADMSDMSEASMENRYIVSEGLTRIHNPAIKKIVGSFPFNSTAITFSIAPLINASNRVDKNEIAMRAFMADDNKEVLRYVKELRKCKNKQNEEVNMLWPGIIAQADLQSENKVIAVLIESDTDIAGLLGNKLLGRYQRPLIIGRHCINDGREYITGSARAIGVKDFRRMCNDTGLAEAGGHEMAFGITVDKRNWDEFLDRIRRRLVDIEFEINTIVDVELSLSDINRDLVEKVKAVDKISGEGFKPIIVKVKDITEYEVGSMSEGKHLVIKPNGYINFIKWNYQGSFHEMEENSLLEEPLTFIGNLDSGYLGRNFSLRLVCNDILGVA